MLVSSVRRALSQPGQFQSPGSFERLALLHFSPHPLSSPSTPSPAPSPSPLPSNLLAPPHPRPSAGTQGRAARARGGRAGAGADAGAGGPQRPAAALPLRGGRQVGGEGLEGRGGGCRYQPNLNRIQYKRVRRRAGRGNGVIRSQGGVMGGKGGGKMPGGERAGWKGQGSARAAARRAG